MEETVPRIARESAPQGPVARTLGRWTAAQLTMPGVWSAVEASLAALKAEPGIRWDLRDLQRAGGGEDADDAAARGLGGRLHRRLDADDGQRVVRAQRVRRGRGGGVAGNDQRARTGREQEIADREGALADERIGFLAIGEVARIGDVDDVQARHLPAHLAHDREPAHAGIENAHGAMVGHVVRNPRRGA